MPTKYAEDVRRFGGASPNIDNNGVKRHLGHRDQFLRVDVRTDGLGNILAMPLLRKKPCFARPERHIRGNLGPTWIDKGGDLKWGKTPCNGCRDHSPGVFEACADVASERVRSSQSIQAAMDEWFDACEDVFGETAYKGPLRTYWSRFLTAIIHHGGWTTVNDDAVNLDDARRYQDSLKKRREERAKASAARRGKIVAATTEFEKALQDERDRKAQHLKQLQGSSAAPRWLTKLDDDGCERTADVWQGRELFKRTQGRAKGTAITDWMISKGRDRGMRPQTLRTRVYDDLKRIKRLEDDRGGDPVWEPWAMPALASGTP